MLILTNQSVYICDTLDMVEYFLLYFLSLLSAYFILNVFVKFGIVGNFGIIGNFGIKEQAHNSKINNIR